MEAELLVELVEVVEDELVVVDAVELVDVVELLLELVELLVPETTLMSPVKWWIEHSNE